MAQGILGQFVYVDPVRELVIVRLGKQVGGVSWSRIFRSVAKLYDRSAGLKRIPSPPCAWRSSEADQQA